MWTRPPPKYSSQALPPLPAPPHSRHYSLHHWNSPTVPVFFPRENWVQIPAASVTFTPFLTYLSSPQKDCWHSAPLPSVPSLPLWTRPVWFLSLLYHRNCAFENPQTFHPHPPWSDCTISHTIFLSRLSSAGITHTKISKIFKCNL